MKSHAVPRFLHEAYMPTFLASLKVWTSGAGLPAWSAPAPRPSRPCPCRTRSPTARRWPWRPCRRRTSHRCRSRLPARFCAYSGCQNVATALPASESKVDFCPRPAACRRSRPRTSGRSRTRTGRTRSTAPGRSRTWPPCWTRPSSRWPGTRRRCSAAGWSVLEAGLREELLVVEDHHRVGLPRQLVELAVRRTCTGRPSAPLRASM